MNFLKRLIRPFANRTVDLPTFVTKSELEPLLLNLASTLVTSHNDAESPVDAVNYSHPNIDLGILAREVMCSANADPSKPLSGHPMFALEWKVRRQLHAALVRSKQGETTTDPVEQLSDATISAAESWSVLQV